MRKPDHLKSEKNPLALIMHSQEQGTDLPGNNIVTYSPD